MYAVRRGRIPGIYKTWDECKSQVNAFPGAEYKKFATLQDANTYLGNIHSAGTVDIFAGTTYDLIAYTDGSCIPNSEGNRTAYAYAILQRKHIHGAPNDIIKHADRLPYDTNNRAELYAIYACLYALDQMQVPTTSSVCIRTDSTYVIGCFTNWMDTWKRNGMKKADSTTIENLDIIIPTYELVRPRHIVFEHVKAHAGNTYNELVDSMAHSAASY
jgi:ribonuclease HI